MPAPAYHPRLTACCSTAAAELLLSCCRAASQQIVEDSGDTAKAVAPAKPDVSADDQMKDAIAAGE